MSLAGPNPGGHCSVKPSCIFGVLAKLGKLFNGLARNRIDVFNCCFVPRVTGCTRLDQPMVFAVMNRWVFATGGHVIRTILEPFDHFDFVKEGIVLRVELFKDAKLRLAVLSNRAVHRVATLPASFAHMLIESFSRISAEPDIYLAAWK